MLVVDDEPAVQQLFRHVFGREGWEVLCAATAQEGAALAAGGALDCAALDVLLPDGSGLDLLRRLIRMQAALPVVVMTSADSSDVAIEALGLGALDFLRKPLDVGELRRLVERGCAARSVPARAETSGPPRELLIGKSAAMERLYKAIGRVAPLALPVLIQGESGTGKELVARALHHYGPRRAGPFVAVNCAAIPETLLESELFGHERGAFTGADRARKGLLEQGAGGTLLLDEIGDMELRLQGKLLRVLQDGSFRRLGGEEARSADVRIVAATHRDLEAWAERGDFRADLFHRLNGFTLRVPPLRERDGDLELLLEHFLARASRELGRSVSEVSDEALSRLRAHSWPGNVRELERVVRQAVLSTIGPRLEVEALPERVGGPRPVPAAPADLDGAFVEARIAEGTTALYDELVARVEERLLRLVLDRFQGNLTAAAKTLGLSRTTLRAKLRARGLVVDRGGHCVGGAGE